MTVPASTRQRVTGALLVLAALVYLIHFVPRGWIAHDEGMLGQSAELVMRGRIPHVDYWEPYTGGLAWLYAGVFRISGVDLVNLRWALFVGASLAMWLMYSIVRRYLGPISSGLAIWVGLAWSFPNWFTALPSWWLLVCALWCIWCVIRHVETGRWQYVATAGLAAGIAVALKQTGVYLFCALVTCLLFSDQAPLTDQAPRHGTSPDRRLGRLLSVGFALAAVSFAGAILARRLLGAEGLYLFLPIAACSAVLVMRPPSSRLQVQQTLKLVSLATAAAALPMALLLGPYLVRHQLSDFLYGAFVLPRTRLTFASLPMPPAGLIVLGVPFLWLALPLSGSASVRRSRILEVSMWLAALTLPVLAIWSLVAYQVIWQSTRAFAALLPLAICWSLAAGHVRDDTQRKVLFLITAMLAWASLNQYPWAAPAYFCYVAPLAVIAVIAISSARSNFQPRVMLPWALMLILFEVLGPHRGYMRTVGAYNAPRHFDTALDLERAHLTVTETDARLYQRLISTTEQHLGGGQLIAGPDCPEVYFLLGRFSPSGALFDFLSEDSEHLFRDAPGSRSAASVMVIDLMPRFSPPLTPDILRELAHEFPKVETIGKFEVRWR